MPQPTDPWLTKCTNQPTGRLYSPGYPHNYPNNVNYTRIITTTTNNTRWNFTIIDFQTAIDDEQSSCGDYLEVRRESGGKYFRKQYKMSVIIPAYIFF